MVWQSVGPLQLIIRASNHLAESSTCQTRALHARRLQLIKSESCTLGAYTLHAGASPNAHLHCAKDGNGGGIIDDALAKHQVEERRRAVLLQHLQHCHAIGGHEDGCKRQAVLPPPSQVCESSLHANKMCIGTVLLKGAGARSQAHALAAVCHAVAGHRHSCPRQAVLPRPLRFVSISPSQQNVQQNALARRALSRAVLLEHLQHTTIL